MPFTNDTLLETSILSSSQINFNNKNHRPSKRFRPLVQCNHIDKLTNEQCTADGFMECVHCDQICCLIHITQHQDELKQLRDNLLEEASETYITLSEMQVTDSRKQLQSNLVLWKTRMLTKIERIYGKLLDDVEESFVKVSSDFEVIKKNLANEFEENVSSKLERLSSKCDFYPHELDELRLSLNEMHIRIREARTSMINIDFGNGNMCLLDSDDRFEFTNNIESPKITIQTKPDIERILNGSYLRQFNIEIDNDSNHIPLLYDTSNTHLLVCNHESNTLELFNHVERIGGGFWPKDYSLITCIKWCSYLNTFLVLCSQSLYALNCCQEPFNIYPITQVTPIDGNPMKYISINNDILLIKHGHGLFVDSYSLEKMELIKRWTKNDFYPDTENTIYIHRIELYSNFCLAMNVEIDEDNDVLDLFIFPNMQHLRRIDNSYLLLYLPLNNYWIIKQKKENNQTDLCLLDQHGHIDQLNINNSENIKCIRLFGKNYLLVMRQNKTSILMQLFHIDKF
ncbi:unnamed protein product [Rotaria socialis]|uniref:Uncharacterized protein n=1 Tax=Rotaria socialis TaxID=392032 RepID=A0A817U2K8_9BILA|nr:unnamed protein product [Rotaria socialis]CAF3329938.1 unnamed protein product [Rotaria socialis]CAF3413785.1 unnamed protein product [Rotaria socialis]